MPPSVPDALDTVLEWMVDRNTMFLVGAGCSRCAGKPLIDDLSSRIAKKLAGAPLAIFNDLKRADERSPNVEDLLTHLLRLRSIAASRKMELPYGLGVADIESTLAVVNKQIIDEIGTDYIASPIHIKFFQRLSQRAPNSYCDLFSLNYDTVIEASLDEGRFEYVDGFRGWQNGYFDPSVFDTAPLGRTMFRLYKMHGSVDWFRGKNDAVRRTPADKATDHIRALIYPSEQKYVETRFGVYESLMAAFRRQLRQPIPNTKLIVLGYSFSDEHINAAILDALIVGRHTLTVFAFLGPEPDPVKQDARLNDIAAKCGANFNAFVPGHDPVGGALDKVEWDSIANKDLWKFENLATLLAGE